MAGCQPKRRTMLEPFQETTQNVLQCNLQDEVRRTNQKNYMQDSGIDSRSRLLLESIHSEYGVLNDKIVVRPSKLGGYGIFLVSSIETNDVVFRVPLHTMITEEKSKDSVIGKAVQKVFGENIPNRIILTLYLLHLRRMTSANNLSSSRISNTLRYYLRCLPVSYNTPLFLASLEAAEGREIFKEDEREIITKDFHRLLGTAVGERERNRFVQIKNTYNALFPKLSISFPEIFLPQVFTFENYVWAHSTIATRLFPTTFCCPNNPNAEKEVDPSQTNTVPGGCLVPIADFLNHRRGTCLRWYTDNEILYACAPRAMAAGEEVFFSYGDNKSNGHLLVTYGFCEPFNENDVAPISFSLSTTRKDLFDLGKDYIKSVGMPLTVATLRRIDCDIKSNSSILRCCRLCSVETVDEFNLYKINNFEKLIMSSEIKSIDYGIRVLQQTLQSIAMGKGSVQELIDTIEGEACKSLIPNVGRNSLLVDDILWYLYGQYKSILHTIKVLNTYKFRLVGKSYSKQKPNENHSDRIIRNMRLALAEAHHALEHGEVPVGCVFIKPSPVNESGEDSIIASASNKTNITSNATRHAELVAYDIGFMASRCNKDILRGCELYVTVEPCIMCAAALARIGIKRVYYGCRNDKFGGNGSILSCHSLESMSSDLDTSYHVVPGVLENEAVELLREFYSRGNPKAPVPHRKKAMLTNNALKD
eukprot:g8169.t1